MFFQAKKKKKNRFQFANPIKKVLIVCTGNICRSPMAEFYLSDRLEKQGAQGRVFVFSAGTHALVSAPAGELARNCMKSMTGLSLASHVAQQVDFTMIQEADLVLAMEEHHHWQILALVPEATEKTYILRGFPHHGKRRGVLDPYGMGAKVYQSVFQKIQEPLDLVCTKIIESL